MTTLELVTILPDGKAIVEIDGIRYVTLEKGKPAEVGSRIVQEKLGNQH